VVSDLAVAVGEEEMICSECSKKLVNFDNKPYTCNYCGGTYCINHHLPENHECNLIEKNMFEKLKEKKRIEPKLKPEMLKKKKPIEPKRSEIITENITEKKAGLIDRIKGWI